MTGPPVARLFEEFMTRHHGGESPDLYDYLELADGEADVLADMIEAALIEGNAPPISPQGRHETVRALEEADAEEAEDRRAWAAEWSKGQKFSGFERVAQWSVARAKDALRAGRKVSSAARGSRPLGLSVTMRTARRLRLFEFLSRNKDRGSR